VLVTAKRAGLACIAEAASGHQPAFDKVSFYEDSNVKLPRHGGI